MTFRERMILVVAALVVALSLVTPTLLAQLQQSGGGPTAVTITSGTVTANIGTTNGLALDSSLTTLDTDLKANIVLKAGANVIGKVGIDQTTPGTTNLVQVGGTLPAFAATPTFNMGTMGALVTGSATIGAVIYKTPCGTTVVNQALLAVPTSPTAVFSSTTCLMGAYFNNTNASAQTVTLTDNAGTPLNGVGPAFSVPGLSNLFLPYMGVQFSSGVRWTAGGAGVTGAMWGYQ